MWDKTIPYQITRFPGRVDMGPPRASGKPRPAEHALVLVTHTSVAVTHTNVPVEEPPLPLLSIMKIL